MTNHVHPKSDLLQPHIHEGEVAHYRDAGYWSKQVAFVRPDLELRVPPLPFANMTALVEAEARRRFPKFDQLSKSKRKKICEQIAHSAVNRPNIKETAHLEAKLIKHLGIRETIINDLCKELSSDDEYAVAAIEKLVDDFLANYHQPLDKEHQFADRLLHYQKRLIEIFTNEQIYLRNFGEFTHHSFLNEFGERIKLHMPIASSKDRHTPHLQNARLVKSGDRFLAVTGRPDTKQKAIEQAEFLIRSGQAKNGELHYVVNSYLSFHIEEQKGMLQKEINALRELEGKSLEVDGQSYIIHPILFNTQIAMKTFEPFAPYDLSGKQVSDHINADNFRQLEALVGNGNDPLIRKALEQLKSPHLLAEEEILLRAFICEKLGIPSVHHCASSKDRTTIGLAIAGALRKWIELHELIGKNPFPDGNLLSLWKNESFKHLIAQELPGYHQLSRNGLGTRGTILGKQLYDDDIGLRINNGVIARILPMEYVKEASLAKKALMTLAAACAWMLCTLIALARLLIFPIALYNPQAAKEGFLNIFRIHRFASLVPSKELDFNSPYVKDRHLIYKAGAAKPRFLLDLEKAPLDAMIEEMQQPKPVIKKEHREALVLIANNWDRFKKLKTSKKLKKLIDLCDKSPLTLFQLRKRFTPEFATKIKNLWTPESIPDSLQREALLESIETDGIYVQIERDVVAKRGANTLIEVIHKEKRLPILNEEPSKIMEKLAQFPFAENGKIPLPLQALLTQTGKSAADILFYTIYGISDQLMVQERSHGVASWDISLHVLDDNTVQAKYRAPFEIRKMADDQAQTMSLLSLEFSHTFQRQAGGKWVQTSSTLDRIHQKFNAQHDMLFTTDTITRTVDEMVQEAREYPGKASDYAKKLVKVLDKNPSLYKPKLIYELQQLKSIDPAQYEKFVRNNQIVVTTNRFG